MKTSIVETVQFSLSLSEAVHLEDFGEDNSYFTTVPYAKIVFLDNVFHLLKADMVMLCSLFSKSA